MSKGSRHRLAGRLVLAGPAVLSSIIVFVAVLSLAGPPGLSAEERALPKVAATGEPAGGTTEAFWVLDGSPVINASGDVAFRAGIAPADAGPAPTVRRGIWRGRASTGQVEAVALAGQPAPGIEGGSFASFSLPAILPGGDVLFLASTDGDLSFDALFRASPSNDVELLFSVETVATRFDNFAAGGGSSVMLQTDASLLNVTDIGNFGTVTAVGDTAPDSGGAMFSILSLPAFDSLNQLALLATLTGAGVSFNNDGGIWRYRAGSGFNLLMREGAAAPAMAANGNQLFYGGPSAEPSIDGQGGIAFLTPLSGGTLETMGIFRGTGAGDLAPVAIRGPLYPSSAGDVSFTALLAPALGADGSVYFAASASVRPPDPRPSALRGVVSLWRASGGTISLVAGMGGAAPGTSELFGRITGFAVDEAGRVTFGAELFSPGPGTFVGFGLWAEESPGGAPALIVRTGDTVRLSPTDVRTVAPGADAIQLLNPWRSTTDSLRRGPAEGIPSAVAGGHGPVYRLRFEGGGVLGSYGFFGASFDPAAPMIEQPVVNSPGDAPDLDPGDGVCDTGASVAGQPECTLRAAIQEANALEGAYRITFAIDAPGTPTIFPHSALPAVSKKLTIDATTQETGRVSISGASAGAGVDGLVINAGGCSLRGLTITSYRGRGLVSNAADVTLLAPDVSANGGDGIAATSGEVIVEGGLRCTGNAGHGVNAFGDVQLSGETHEASSNGLAGIHTSGRLESAGNLRLSGNGTRRTSQDCALGTVGAIEAAGDVVVESVEARSDCGSGIATSGTIELDFCVLVDNKGYGALSTAGDIKLGVQCEISRNKFDGLRCENGTLESSSLLEVIANEGHGIRSREVHIFGGEPVVERNGLDGISARGLVRVGVTIHVNQNGTKRTPLECAEHRVGGITTTAGNMLLHGVEATGNCGSGIYCENGAVTCDSNATLTNNSQFGIWCPSDEVTLGGNTNTVSDNGKDGIFAVKGDVFVAGTSVFHNNGRLQLTACADEKVAAIYTQGLLTILDAEISNNCGSGIRANGVRAGVGGGGIRLLDNTQFGIVSLGDPPVEIIGDEHQILRNGLDGIYSPNAPVRIEGKAIVVGNNRNLTAEECKRDPPVRAGICTGKRIEGDEVDARLNCGTGLIASQGIDLQRATCSQNTQHGVYSFSGGLILHDTGHFFSQNGGDGILVPTGQVQIAGVIEANKNGRNGITCAGVKLESGEICENGQLGIDIFNLPGGIDIGSVRVDCNNGRGAVRTYGGAIVVPRSPGLKVEPASNPSPGDTPPGKSFPTGLHAVSAGAAGGNGGGEGGGAGAQPLAVELVLELPPGVEVDTYYNYGPTADQPAPHWYEFLFDGVTGAEVEPGRVVLHLVDGLRGDDDLAENGAIHSLGGPAGPSPGGPPQLPGDCNRDGVVNISDAICILGFLFLGMPERLPCGDGLAAHPGNRALLDWQPDGKVNLADAVASLSFLFLGGPPHVLGGPGTCAILEDCPPSPACP